MVVSSLPWCVIVFVVGTIILLCLSVIISDYSIYIIVGIIYYKCDMGAYFTLTILYSLFLYQVFRSQDYDSVKYCLTKVFYFVQPFV